MTWFAFIGVLLRASATEKTAFSADGVP